MVQRRCQHPAAAPWESFPDKAGPGRSKHPLMVLWQGWQPRGCLSQQTEVFWDQGVFLSCLSRSQQSHHSVNDWGMDRENVMEKHIPRRQNIMSERKSRNSFYLFFLFLFNLVATSWPVSVLSNSRRPHCIPWESTPSKVNAMWMDPPPQGVQHSCPEYGHPCSQALSKEVF